MMADPPKFVDSSKFYATYHGHEPKYLHALYNHFKGKATKFVYFAGDSSLDNKYWLNSNCSAINGYEEILKPPKMIPDVAFHLNSLCANHPKEKIVVLNCAVEATTLGSRSDGWLGKGDLYSQDIFIRDHIRPEDTLIVSVGGNDIALSPSVSTIFNMLGLLYLHEEKEINENILKTWGGSHFVEMFGKQTKKYIRKLISKTKPKKVIICLIYFPDETATGSWADPSLGALGYNSNPAKLQSAIRQVFIHATSQIKLDGVEVVPFPMFEVMDGKTSSDYVQRVEPSSQGGKKLAQALMQHL